MQCVNYTEGQFSFTAWVRRNVWEIATTSFIVVLLLSQFSYFADRELFGQDDLSVTDSYYRNLETEGRWINWLFFSVLHYVNSKMLLIVDYSMLGFFGYCCLRNWLCVGKSVLGALVIMLLPSASLFLDWPIIAFPAFFILAIAAIVYSKMPLWLFFTVFGILFNATFSNMYFLLPLLFLKGGVKEMWMVLIYWVIGYLVGFAVAQGVTYALCGHFIELSDWRRPNYIESWEAVRFNLARGIDNLNTHIRYLGKMGGVMVLVAIPLFCYSWRQDKLRGLTVGIILVLVALSCYAQAFPAGILVSLRTVHALYLAILLGLIVSIRQYRFLFLVCLMMWSCRCFYMNVRNLEWQNVQRNAFYSGIGDLELRPETLDGVVILISEQDVKSVAKKIEKRMGIACYSTGIGMYYMTPVLREAGFKSLHYAVHISDFIKEFGVAPETLSYERKGIYEYSICKNYLWLRLAPVDGNE